MRKHWAAVTFGGALLSCTTPGVGGGQAAQGRAAIERADSSHAPAAAVKWTLLAEQPLVEAPGLESRLYLAELAPGVEEPVRAISEQCVGYVVEGSLEATLGGAPVSVIRAGEGFVEDPSQPHKFRNPEPGRRLRLVVAGTFHAGEAFLQEPPGSTSAPPTVARGAADDDAVPASDHPITEVKRNLLAQRDVPGNPGMESRIYLAEFPPGAESKIHIHTAQTIGYVLEGGFESAFGDDAPTQTHAGQTFVDLPGRPHHFKNVDSARPLRIVFAGTFHKEDPLFRLALQ